MKSGFTLIELILVVGLFLTIGAMATPFASNFLLRVYHESTSLLLITSLERAQSLSMEGKGSGNWGICLYSTNIVRVYSGSCNTPTQKEDSLIPSTVSISGLSDTTFARLSGDPSNTLNITINSRIDSSSITMSPIGVINVN